MAQIKRNDHLKIAGKRRVAISSAGILRKESLTNKGRFLPASWLTIRHNRSPLALKKYQTPQLQCLGTISNSDSVR